MSSARNEGRQRRRIEERGRTLRVIVYAGVDPVTGKRSYLRETIDGTDKAARKRAEKALNKLLAQVDGQRSAPSSTSLSYALDEWMRTNEIEASTRAAYAGYIDRTIRPALGDVAVNKIAARTLEGFYTDLRRCRARCDGKPYIERHKKSGEHDCAGAKCKPHKCKPHKCKPMAASTVRQIHFIISGTLDAAERWDWIGTNPARVARKPKQKPPEPDPPTHRQRVRDGSTFSAGISPKSCLSSALRPRAQRTRHPQPSASATAGRRAWAHRSTARSRPSRYRSAAGAYLREQL